MAAEATKMKGICGETADLENEEKTAKSIYIHSIYIVYACKMKNRAVILRLSYGYVAVIIW